MLRMIVDEIEKLKRERSAVILAHNYSRPEVQDIADFTGDSLELARKATEIEAPVIVFCGVYFMAETAKILNPSKKVLIPDPSAGCPMADMITAQELRLFKCEHPGAKVVCYVNSTAEVKAECDISVTSGNAEKILSTMKGEKILFVPDMHLGSYVAEKLGEKYECWKGCCPIHAALKAEEVEASRRANPGAVVFAHPECNEGVRKAADECLSTGGMCARAKEVAAKKILVATEKGILHRLKKENPEKEFVAVGELECCDMKKATLENVRDALLYMRHEVVVDEEISRKAKRSIDSMLAVK
jgi:quinolinate synthase